MRSRDLLIYAGLLLRGVAVTAPAFYAGTVLEGTASAAPADNGSSVLVESTGFANFGGVGVGYLHLTRALGDANHKGYSDITIKLYKQKETLTTPTAVVNQVLEEFKRMGQVINAEAQQNSVYKSSKGLDLIFAEKAPTFFSMLGDEYVWLPIDVLRNGATPQEYARLAHDMSFASVRGHDAVAMAPDVAQMTAKIVGREVAVEFYSKIVADLNQALASSDNKNRKANEAALKVFDSCLKTLHGEPTAKRSPDRDSRPIAGTPGFVIKC